MQLENEVFFKRGGNFYSQPAEWERSRDNKKYMPESETYNAYVSAKVDLKPTKRVRKKSLNWQ